MIISICEEDPPLPQTFQFSSIKIERNICPFVWENILSFCYIPKVYLSFVVCYYLEWKLIDNHYTAYCVTSAGFLRFLIFQRIRNWIKVDDWRVVQWSLELLELENNLKNLPNQHNNIDTRYKLEFEQVEVGVGSLKINKVKRSVKV